MHFWRFLYHFVQKN